VLDRRRDPFHSRNFWVFRHSAAPVAVVRPGEGYSQSVEAYFREVERHMQSQLDLITEALGVDSVEYSLGEDELESLEAQVALHVNQVDDR
jgi:hypothetical protein